MLDESHTPTALHASPLANLLLLGRRARQAAGSAELGFVLANETRQLAPYRQAVVWLADTGLVALSGVVSPEANAPYAQWLQRMFVALQAQAIPGQALPEVLHADTLPPDLAAQWHEWLPPEVLWCPFGQGLTGGLLLARDEPWQDAEQGLLAEWVDTWATCWALHHKPTAWQATRRRWQALLAWRPGAALRDLRQLGWRALWRQPGLRWAVLLLLICLLPVRLSVLAPGELVPAHPAVIRAPLDGIIDKVMVLPNQKVTVGQVLFEFDRISLTSRINVAEQAQATAEAEYRQAAQQALFDVKSKAQLAIVQGKLAEKATELRYLQELNTRAGVSSPRDGVVMFGDATEWIGRPVAAGERVMVVADETDAEVEAWLSPGDMIDLAPGAAVSLYLNASPFAPVAARVKHIAHSAQQRPDGSFAYRLRADIQPGEARQRVGLKGTVKVSGTYVMLVYWVLRKPLAALRQFVGL